jgi:hypothetical protein
MLVLLRQQNPSVNVLKKETLFTSGFFVSYFRRYLNRPDIRYPAFRLAGYRYLAKSVSGASLMNTGTAQTDGYQSLAQLSNM